MLSTILKKRDTESNPELNSLNQFELVSSRSRKGEMSILHRGSGKVYEDIMCGGMKNFFGKKKTQEERAAELQKKQQAALVKKQKRQLQDVKKKLKKEIPNHKLITSWQIYSNKTGKYVELTTFDDSLITTILQLYNHVRKILEKEDGELILKASNWIPTKINSKDIQIKCEYNKSNDHNYKSFQFQTEESTILLKYGCQNEGVFSRKVSECGFEKNKDGKTITINHHVRKKRFLDSFKAFIMNILIDNLNKYTMNKTINEIEQMMTRSDDQETTIRNLLDKQTQKTCTITETDISQINTYNNHEYFIININQSQPHTIKSTQAMPLVERNDVFYTATCNSQ